MIIIILILLIFILIASVIYYTDEDEKNKNKNNNIFTQDLETKAELLEMKDISKFIQYSSRITKHFMTYKINLTINLFLTSVIVVNLSVLLIMIIYYYSNFFVDTQSEQVLNYNPTKEIINNMKNEIIYFINQSSLFNEISNLDSILQILNSGNDYENNIILELSRNRLINSNIDPDSSLELYRLLGIKDYRDFLFYDSSSYWNEISKLDPFNWENRRFNSQVIHNLSETNPESMSSFRSFVFQEIINTHLNQAAEIDLQTKYQNISRSDVFTLSICLCLISLFLINTTPSFNQLMTH